MKKLAAAILLSLALTCCVCAANGVITEKATIAGKSADLVYFKMGDGRTGEVRTPYQAAIGDQKVADMLSAVKKQSGKALVAAINGGYFNSYYSTKQALSFPGNSATIYAAIMQNGNMLLGGGKAPTLGFTSSGQPLIDWVDVKTTVRVRDAQDVAVWGVNRFYTDPSAVLYFTPAMNMSIPVPATSKVFYIVNGVVTKISNGFNMRVPSGTQLLVYNQLAYANAVKYTLAPELGNSATLLPCTMVPSVAANAAAWSTVTNLVSAGPMILLGGKDVTGQNPEFSGKQAPNSVGARSFAAVMKDGRLVFGTATASMRQLATYFISKGARDVMSLDGGASSMLYVEGKGYMRSAGRKLSNIITIVDYANGTLPPAPAAKPDTASIWADASVQELSSMGIIPQGLSSLYQSNITRQEFAQLIMRLVEAKSSKSRKALILETGIAYDSIKYSDAYELDVIDVSRLKLMSGTGNGRFSPHGSITREQAATIIAQTARLLSKEAPSETTAFGDSASISSWAAEGVAFTSGHGIMSGSGNIFRPKAYFTREEAFVTIKKLIDVLP